MDWSPHIVGERETTGGKPVVRGTRLTVDFLLGLLAEGWTPEQLLENYPRLTMESLCAVFAFAADTVGAAILYPRSRTR